MGGYRGGVPLVAVSAVVSQYNNKDKVYRSTNKSSCITNRITKERVIIFQYTSHIKNPTIILSITIR